MNPNQITNYYQQQPMYNPYLMQPYQFQNPYQYSQNINKLDKNNQFQFRQTTIQSDLPEAIRIKLSDNLDFN